MADLQVNPQDLLDAVIAQRNALMNELAMAQAIIKAKDARIAELEAPSPPPLAGTDT